MRKDSLSITGARKNWIAACKRMNQEYFIKSYIKINSKWIKDLNVRPESIKLLEENLGSTLFYVNHGKIIFDPPPRVM